MKNCNHCGSSFTPQKGLINFCSLSCRSSRIHSAETKAKISNSVKSNYSSKPTLIEDAKIRLTGTKHTTETKHKISKKIKLMYLENPELIEQAKIHGSKATISDTGRKKLRQLALDNNLGGNNSKRSLRYKLQNGGTVYLQSSYEIALAKSLDENNIAWIRPQSVTWIDEQQITHKYYPDFYLPEFNVYLDPKNDYLIQKDFLKIKSVRDQNGINILMFGKEYLDWENLKTLL